MDDDDFCERCFAKETLEDGFTCAKCGAKPIPMWGTIDNLYAGLDDDEPYEPVPKNWFKRFICFILNRKYDDR